MNLENELKQHALTLDGSMSTALEALGVKTNTDLWTAAALVTNQADVYRVHYDYFKAGARVTITDTYQTNVAAFEKYGYSKQEARAIIRQAAEIAKKARDDFEKKTGVHNYIAGSIGPYGAYLANGSEYRGDYELSKAEFQEFHLPRLEELVAAGVDVLAIETQPKLSEVLALLDLLQTEFSNQKAYVSFSLKDAHTISDGTSLETAVKAIEKYSQVIAVGINCIDISLAQTAITVVARVTDKPIVVYPNSGAVYNPVTKTWQAPEKVPSFGQCAATWYAAGARLIGGCCTTVAKDIQEIADYLGSIEK